MRVRWACGDFELRCKITAFLWHGNGLSPDLWGSCPLTCETAWGKTAEDDNFRKNSEKHLQKIAPFCAILRRRKKAHSKICSTHFFVVILQRHSFRRMMVFRYLYHEETPKLFNHRESLCEALEFEHGHGFILLSTIVFLWKSKIFSALTWRRSRRRRVFSLVKAAKVCSRWRKKVRSLCS